MQGSKPKAFKTAKVSIRPRPLLLRESHPIAAAVLGLKQLVVKQRSKMHTNKHKQATKPSRRTQRGGGVS